MAIKTKTAEQVYEMAAISAAEILKSIKPTDREDLEYIVACDACLPHPTYIQYGVAVFVNSGSKFELMSYKFGNLTTASDTTSNVAEWHALIEAVKMAIPLAKFGTKIIIASDSNLIVNQANGLWPTSKFPEQAKRFVAAMDSFIDKPLVIWVSGKQNSFADAISRGKVPPEIGDLESDFDMSAPQKLNAWQKKAKAIAESIKGDKFRNNEEIVAELLRLFRI
jgi:ribonuclease HI